MTDEDVDFFLEKLQADFPDTYELALRLNPQGGELILEGLRAYGSLENSTSVETRLRIALWIHCHGSIDLPWSRPGRDPRRSDDNGQMRKRSRGKRRRGDKIDTLRDLRPKNA